MYCGVASSKRHGGLRQGLSRARYANISGDKGSGLAKLRKEISGVEAYVIEVGSAGAAKELGRAIVEACRPKWNQSPVQVASARRDVYETRNGK